MLCFSNWQLQDLIDYSGTSIKYRNVTAEWEKESSKLVLKQKGVGEAGKYFGLCQNCSGNLGKPSELSKVLTPNFL